MQRYSEKIQPVYLEQLCFAINRAGWSVTKIYSQYTFKQECFKKSSRQIDKMQKILLRKIPINSCITQISDMIVTTI